MHVSQRFEVRRFGEDRVDWEVCCCAGGAAMMSRFTELKWAARDTVPGSRVVNFTRNGEKRFSALFGESE